MSTAHDITNNIIWAIEQAANHTHNATEWDNPEYGDDRGTPFNQFIAPMLADVTVRIRELEARIAELEGK